MTYQDVIDLIEKSPLKLFVPVTYLTGQLAWLPVDKAEYVKQIKSMDDPAQYEYPCLMEVDGDLFIHPKMSP